MKTKLVVILVLTILTVIFVLQNTAVISVRLWFWEASISRALLIVLCLAIGIIIGIIIPSSGREKKELPPEE
ncbi:MAG: DUF1049 domain-containing protein [Bacteroidia bacterium]|nr:MAG: DUF1049 domain-containing protein [Bacteroidia bacterium]